MWIETVDRCYRKSWFIEKKFRGLFIFLVLRIQKRIGTNYVTVLFPKKMFEQKHCLFNSSTPVAYSRWDSQLYSRLAFSRFSQDSDTTL